MSEALWSGIIGALVAGVFVIIGALMAGVFLIGAQVWASFAQARTAREASNAQAEMAREAAKAQADLARDAWERSQRARAHDALEAACLEVIRYAQQIENAVHNWETGAIPGTRALALINSAGAAVTEVGYGILLRRPYDLAGNLIGRLLLEADGFTKLNDPRRTPPATVAEKQAQALVVGTLKTQLYDHIHAMLKADAEA
jgi:hypothetical protein